MTVADFLLPLFSLVVGLRAGLIGNWLGVIDRPGARHKLHSTPTPLVGGIAVALPLFVACAIRFWKYPDLAIYGTLIIAICGAFLLGFFDDRKSLPSGFRFVAGVALVLLALALVPEFIVDRFDFSFLAEEIPLHPFAVLFSVVVIVGMMNAINMADGMNGLVCGLCLIWTVFLMFFAPPHTLPILVVLAICLLVTLIFNLRGRLFMGDSGTYGVGITLSLLCIYIYNTSSVTLRADLVVAWFIVPVLDCLRLMAVRACERRSPMSADTNHLHHRLLRIFPRWLALITYWMLVAVPGAVAIAVPSLTGAVVLAVAGVYLGLLLLTSTWFAAARAKIQA